MNNQKLKEPYLTGDDVYVSMSRVQSTRLSLSPPKSPEDLCSISYDVGEVGPDHEAFKELADRLNEKIAHKHMEEVKRDSDAAISFIRTTFWTNDFDSGSFELAITALEMSGVITPKLASACRDMKAKIYEDPSLKHLIVPSEENIIHRIYEVGCPETFTLT